MSCNFRAEKLAHQWPRHVPRGLCMLGLAAWAATAAAADPYLFSASGVPYGSGPVAAFGGSATVAGAFLYDPGMPATGTAGNGATLYNLSLTALSGTVIGMGFSDPGGYTAVGNNLPLNSNNDYLQLGADPTSATGTRNFVGFTLGDYTLVNLRIFWIPGQLGIVDFLNSAQLPPVLPLFPGRLALDFVPTATPAGPLSFVFFDGVTVTAVPEPPTAAMWGAALAIGALLARRRSRHSLRSGPGA